MSIDVIIMFISSLLTEYLIYKYTYVSVCNTVKYVGISIKH